jgi:enoyl-CoA hydratase/carnithine racemase
MPIGLDVAPRPRRSSRSVFSAPEGLTGRPDMGGAVSATVRLEVSDGIAVVTLDRPEARNAFTGQMGRELAAAYRASDVDDAVRAVVVTGTPPAFCAGADTKAGAKTFVSPGPGFSSTGVDFPAWQVRKPVIAAVNGHAIGIGLTLALQCDLRVMAADAKYGVVQVRRGVMGDAWSHWTLPRIVGIGRAAEMLLVGGTFDGQRARELGLTDRVLPADEVLPAALALATDIATNAAPLSVAVSKRLLWLSFELDVQAVAEAETTEHLRLMAHPDVREAMSAVIERRTPVWRGRISELDAD